ncbi:MAG: hypothetical protein Q4G48_01405, partial [Bacteroidia bacterium]|nr:hypothetical protein [Bacteroidia bacterium]
MKRNIFASLFILILISGLILGTTSCSNDNVAETQWKVVNISVNKADWEWKSADGFYQATAKLPELTQFIFDEGAALGYYKFSNNSKTALPYVKTYS